MGTFLIGLDKDGDEELTGKSANPKLATATQKRTMPYVKLTTQSELPAVGEAKEFELGDKVICVANVNGTITAMDNVCLHMGGPLGQGFLEGDKLICPWHGWEYDVRTGQLLDDPQSKVALYPIKVENGDVMVEV